MIILAEDDADQRTALKFALELGGYHVREASNGREALALQRQRAAAILITDLFMPEADGFEAISAFRGEFPGTKIVAISGGARRVRQDYLPTAALLADVTLRKPVDPNLLLKTLAKLS